MYAVEKSPCCATGFFPAGNAFGALELAGKKREIPAAAGECTKLLTTPICGKSKRFQNQNQIRKPGCARSCGVRRVEPLRLFPLIAVKHAQNAFRAFAHSLANSR
jgi:hypothetical protein